MMKRTRTLERPEKDRTIPVSLGKPSLRIRLEAYYKLLAPDNLANEIEWRSRFEQIWSKFGGSHEGERRLAAKLAKKYGTSVRLLLARSAESSASHQAPARPTTAQHDEEWYAIQQGQRGSNDLCFTSKSFDPEAVLRVSEEEVVRANPFVSNCSLLDHVEKFRKHLPPCDPLHRPPTISGQKRSQTSSSGTDKEAAKRPKILPPFAALAQANDRGPISLLHEAFLNRCRIRVLIRYVNCIRGTLTGILIAYDKHMNMILRDAEEVYTPRYTDDTAEVTNAEKELQRRQRGITNDVGATLDGPWTVRRRHMKQLLVRGDNVVMVYKAESERSAWPHTSKSPAKSLYRHVDTTAPEIRMRIGTPGSLIYAQPREKRRRLH